jgi:hypothetical protein
MGLVDIGHDELPLLRPPGERDGNLSVLTQRQRSVSEAGKARDECSDVLVEKTDGWALRGTGTKNLGHGFSPSLA